MMLANLAAGMRIAEVDPLPEELVWSMAMPPLDVAPPTLFQRDLMPSDVAAAMDKSWSRGRVDYPSVCLYRLRDVYVLEEGLVFTAAGALVRCTRTQHTEDEVTRASALLQKRRAGGKAIPAAKRAVLGKKRGAQNYGHFVVEMLPKALVAQRALGPDDTGWQFLVQSVEKALQAAMLESLGALGVSPKRILACDDQPIHKDELLIVDGLSAHPAFISPLVMECMDAIAAKAPPAPARRLYVPRRPAKTRDFAQEPEIAKMLRGRGYAEVVTAKLPFLQQVAAFRAAESVVGPMGSALTNIIFCKPGTEIIVFGPASAMEIFFWTIAQARGLRYYEVRCKEVGPQTGLLPWDRALQITPLAVHQILNQITAPSAASLWSPPAAPTSAKPTPALPPSASPIPMLSPEFLCTGNWVWHFSTGFAAVHLVRFQPDGTIQGYDHPNEKQWRLADGVLEILGADGACNWCFTEELPRANARSLRATYRDSSPPIAVLTMTQEAQRPKQSWFARLRGRLFSR